MVTTIDNPNVTENDTPHDDDDVRHHITENGVWPLRSICGQTKPPWKEVRCLGDNYNGEEFCPDCGAEMCPDCLNVWMRGG